MARSGVPLSLGLLVTVAVVALAVLLPCARAQVTGPAPLPAAECEAAVRAVERRYALPAGLLAAISRAETGRQDPSTGALVPWPWSVQAEGRGLFFDTKEQAVQWVRDAQARGVASIDTGCLQINLSFHPDAFATLADAFDPRRNADYAARFLLKLHTELGDWRLATGAYHSQTEALAGPYVARVQSILGARPIASLKPASPRLIDSLAEAWHATEEAPVAVPLRLPIAARGWDTLLRRATFPGAVRRVMVHPQPPAKPVKLAAASPSH
ncbi:MAG: hypothetical protein JSR21_01230 [Proteobacteria bacterium]|nr:hypothetical protein [Pseudomonadota bacterium]